MHGTIVPAIVAVQNQQNVSNERDLFSGKSVLFTVSLTSVHVAYLRTIRII